MRRRIRPPPRRPRTATGCGPTRLRPRRGGRCRGTRGSMRRTSAGKRTAVRSWTVTTRAARRVGGTTKFVPWTTSAGPTNHSMGGTERRAQIRCRGRAGMARSTTRIPARARGGAAGGDVSRSRRRRPRRGRAAPPGPRGLPDRTCRHRCAPRAAAWRRRPPRAGRAPTDLRATPGEPCTPGSGLGPTPDQLAWLDDHRPRRRSRCRPPACAASCAP